MLSMVVTLDNLTNTIGLLRRPDGTQQYPTRSCCDLKEQYPDKKSGKSLVIKSQPTVIIV